MRSDGRILMHRRPLEKHHGGLWEFPGGKVEPGEFPAHALARELAEELGIVLDPAELSPVRFAQSDRATGDRPIVILLYSATRWDGEPRALEAGAVIDWFDEQGLALLNKPPLDEVLFRDFFGRQSDPARSISLAKRKTRPYWAPSDARP